MDIIWHTMNTLWWRVAMSFLAGSFLCPPAKAQGFFESLFGFGAAQPKVERAQPRPGVRMGTTPQPFSAWKAERFQSAPADGDGYRRDPAYGGSYKTVCVRTCDGFYWPVSRSVTSERFETDAKRCDAACAGEAKLYYQHKNSDDPRSMVALDGTPYTALKTAFLYRKTLINGCGCKPAPWSTAEQLRHQTYKVADDAKKLQIAVAREREKAEALRQDKIAQIIAATRAAVMMDEAEEATFGEAVAVAVASVALDAAREAVKIDEADEAVFGDTVSTAAVALEANEAVAVDGGDELGVAEVETNPDVSVTGYIHLHVLPDSAVEAEAADVAPAGAEKAGTDVAQLEAAFTEIAGEPAVAAAKNPRKASGRRGARKPAKPVQTVSLFGGSAPAYTWPGDAPARR